MSCLRITIEGEGLNKIVKLSEKSEERKNGVTINGKPYMLYDVRLENDCFCFITGWSDECYDEIEDIRKNIAFSSPGTTFNYFKHSTYSGLDNSFNFGYVNGEYREWDDCKSIAYHGLKLKCEGIVCREADIMALYLVWQHRTEICHLLKKSGNAKRKVIKHMVIAEWQYGSKTREYITIRRQSCV